MRYSNFSHVKFTTYDGNTVQLNSSSFHSNAIFCGCDQFDSDSNTWI